MIVRTSAKSRLTRPGNRDQVGDSLNALPEDVVDHAERLGDRRRALDDLEEAVVLDDDQRVDVVAQVLDAHLGLLGPQAPFEPERPRDDADGQSVELTPDLRDDRCTTGSRATAFSRSDEHHVSALERLFELVTTLVRCLHPKSWVSTRTEAPRRLRADVDLHVGVRHQERLCVRVDSDELNT